MAYFQLKLNKIFFSHNKFNVVDGSDLISEKNRMFFIKLNS